MIEYRTGHGAGAQRQVRIEEVALRAVFRASDARRDARHRALAGALRAYRNGVFDVLAFEHESSSNRFSSAHRDFTSVTKWQFAARPLHELLAMQSRRRGESDNGTVNKVRRTGGAAVDPRRRTNNCTGTSTFPVHGKRVFRKVEGNNNVFRSAHRDYAFVFNGAALSQPVHEAFNVFGPDTAVKVTAVPIVKFAEQVAPH